MVRLLGAATAIACCAATIAGAGGSPALRAGPTTAAGAASGRARIVVKLRRLDPAPLERIGAPPASSVRPLFDAHESGGPARERRSRFGLDRIFRITVARDRIEPMLEKLRGDPNVEFAEEDAEVRADALPDDPFLDSSGSWGQSGADLWGIHRIGAPAAWETTRGAGTVVAVVDTGLDYNHPDIWKNVWVNDRVVADRNRDGRIDLDDLDIDGNHWIDATEIPVDGIGRDFLWGDDDVDDPDPMDENGHGTHVAGTIAATGGNGLGVAGVAYESRVMGLRFLDATGSGSAGDAARALVWAVDHGAGVINASWGGTVGSRALTEAFAYARDAGTLVVVSAGNLRIDVGNEAACRQFPACLDAAFTVAASDPDDARAGFSNRGAAIDLTAPGGNRASDPGVPYAPERNILSLRAAALGDPGLVVGTRYLRLSGTSMAAPHVSGVAALVRARAPEAGVGLVRAILEGAALDVDPPGFDEDSGFGRVDAAEAVRLAGLASASADLAVTSFRLESSRAGPRMPIRFEARVENLGGAASRSFDVIVRDLSVPAQGGPLARFRIDGLGAGEAREVAAFLWLAAAGEHRVVAEADPADVQPELTERNNRAERVVTILPSPFTERRLTDDPFDQRLPRIAGERITWQDERNAVDTGDGSRGTDVYLHDLTSGETRRITFDPGDQTEPVISDRWLAWTDARSGAPELRVLELATGIERAVTGARGLPSSPALSGDLLAWREGIGPSESEIYVQDLRTGEESCVSGGGVDFDPEIDGDRVVWVAPESDGYHSIRFFDLGGGTRRAVARNAEGTGFFAPSTSAGRIVWHDVVRFHSDIWMYDLGPDGEFGTGDCGGGRCEGKVQVTTHRANQTNPSVSGERIVWREQREDISGGDILLYDLGPDGVLGTGDADAEGRAEGETWITRDPYPQSAPRISGRYVVWQDQRNGNWDIYIAALGGQPSAPAGLSAAHGGRGVRLRWADPPSANAASYTIYRRHDREPAWIRIGSSAEARFEDSTAAPGEVFEYAVSASDASGFEGPVSVPASAIANRPPVLSDLVPVTARAGIPLTIHFTADDPDLDAVTVSAEPSPDGLVLAPARRSLRRSDRTTHVLRWQPSDRQVGVHRIEILARDGPEGSSLEARRTVTVTVEPRRRPVGVE